MKKQPVIFVLILCFLGMAISALVYIQGQKAATALFADELNINSLNRLISRGETFIVYFYGRSCEDCAASEPILIKAITQLQENDHWPASLLIYKCEREANSTVRSLYGVEHTPTLIYFFSGEESVRLEGPLPGVAEYCDFFSDLDLPSINNKQAV